MQQRYSLSTVIFQARGAQDYTLITYASAGTGNFVKVADGLLWRVFVACCAFNQELSVHFAFL